MRMICVGDRLETNYSGPYVVRSVFEMGGMVSVGLVGASDSPYAGKRGFSMTLSHVQGCFWVNGAGDCVKQVPAGKQGRLF